MLLKFTVLSISLLIIITGSAVSPILGEISETFSSTPSYLIKMVITLPSIVIIPFSLLSGKIAALIKKRKIIIIGLVIYIIGGIGGGFAANIYYLLFFRAILGVGMGLLTPFSTSLIADFFTGNERTKMMGLSNAVANLGGIIATLIGGWLAIINWRYVFGVYLIAVIALVFIIFGLPEPPRRNTWHIKKHSINSKVLVIALLAFMLNIAFYSVVTNIAFFIKDAGLGNSGVSGIAMSFLSLAGLISGILLQRISMFLKEIRVSAAITLMSFGFLQLSIAFNIAVVLFSTFMIGFGLGILKPILFLKVTEVTPRLSNAFALSIVSSTVLLGKFISPFFINFLGNIFKNNSIRFAFNIIGISLWGAAIISLLYIIQPIKTFRTRYDK
ncbi:MAG: hypothetical protein PWP27_1080 [Clostridiales bacterium]|nr:hypothetical protein [Clostridiales bacterium]